MMFWLGISIGVASASLIILTVIVTLAHRSKVTPWARKAQEETQALLVQANHHRATIAKYLYEIAQHARPGSN